MAGPDVGQGACVSSPRPQGAEPGHGAGSRQARARVGLVLNAGGARGAYQTGALQVLLPLLEQRGERPTVLVGTSAGALTTCLLAGTAHLPAAEQARAVAAGLQRATKENVLRPLWQQVPLLALQYGVETLGLPLARPSGLLGTAPLRRTLSREVDWHALHRNVADGTVDAVTLLATVVRSGRVVGFTESSGAVPDGDPDGDVVYARTRLDVPHAMASAAIPMLFPAVRVDDPAQASGWYVDGATRLRAPLLPALDHGVDRLVVVGTTSLRRRLSSPGDDLETVDLGDTAVSLLNAMIDDALRRDVRRLGEVNAFFGGAHEAALRGYREARGLRPFREVPFVAVVPEDGAEIDDLAGDVYRRRHGRPWRLVADPDLQVLHRALGGDSPLQGELLSFLLFDEEFFRELRRLGRRDAQTWVDAHPDLWQSGPVDVDA